MPVKTKETVTAALITGLTAGIPLAKGAIKKMDILLSDLKLAVGDNVAVLREYIISKHTDEEIANAPKDRSEIADEGYFRHSHKYVSVDAEKLLDALTSK